MTCNFRVALIVAIMIAFFTLAIYAQGSVFGTRSGWGFGDVNRVYTGPPE